MKKLVKSIVEKMKPPNGTDLKTLVEINTRIKALEKVMVGTTLEEAVENGDYNGKEKNKLKEMLETTQAIVKEVME